MKTILFITDVDFWRGGAGHRMRILHLLQFLTASTSVTIVYSGPAPADLSEKLCAVLLNRFTLVVLGDFSSVTARGSHVRDLFKGRHFNAVIVEYIHNSFFLKYLDIEDSMLILDAHDIVSDRTAEFAKFGLAGSYFELSAREELELFALYDIVLVLCQPDLEKINTLFGGRKAILCGHASSIYQHSARDQVRTIGFIASEYQPNIEGITFFVENCWPRLAKKYAVELAIYGNICKKLASLSGERIRLAGYREDIRAVYAEVDIVINPVRFGAGLKIKNIEAMAHGIPLVTTGHGARGLEQGRNAAFLVADDVFEFEAILSMLIEDPARRRQLSADAHAFIRDAFSDGGCYQPLIDILNGGQKLK